MKNFTMTMMMIIFNTTSLFIVNVGGTTGIKSGCCSIDYKTCLEGSTFCNESRENCKSCGNDQLVWLDDGPPFSSNQECVARSMG